jgi:hypothetical protein
MPKLPPQQSNPRSEKLNKIGWNQKIPVLPNQKRRIQQLRRHRENGKIGQTPTQQRLKRRSGIWKRRSRNQSQRIGMTMMRNSLRQLSRIGVKAEAGANDWEYRG